MESYWGFPGSSTGKESTCNAGDLGSVPGLERSPGEGLGYSLQYYWASLVAQMVKNPPVMWETSVPCLGWEDPLEEGMAIHSRVLAWRIPMDRRAWQATVYRVTKSWTWLSDWAYMKSYYIPGRASYASILYCLWCVDKEETLLNHWIVSAMEQ